MKRQVGVERTYYVQELSLANPSGDVIIKAESLWGDPFQLNVSASTAPLPRLGQGLTINITWIGESDDPDPNT